ncbi:hypothetical protein C2S53_011475 [Perilla frutescens var. hirtella]|uniref:Transposase n=1 Tax=Perilla frutescens var. hirtella TaxID=608512 RepID=A0AAD4P1G1_PERFH|nr:hypothetical protein C2S53_011475 [Perilla frutescens var. hirtella]
MYNTVHIDEKWFYMKKETHRFYMTPKEAGPHRTCKSKKFISKIMFMCAVSKPLLAADGSVLFDGKIGVFPFTHKVPAKRSSKNRSRGTLETKAIELITQEVIRDCLINQSCMIEIMKVKGHNGYKIPHMGKDALSRQAILPLNLEVPPELLGGYANQSELNSTEDSKRRTGQNKLTAKSAELREKRID